MWTLLASAMLEEEWMIAPKLTSYLRNIGELIDVVIQTQYEGQQKHDLQNV